MINTVYIAKEHGECGLERSSPIDGFEFKERYDDQFVAKADFDR